MQVLVSKADSDVRRRFIFRIITENKGAHLIYFVFNAEKDIRDLDI